MQWSTQQSYSLNFLLWILGAGYDWGEGICCCIVSVLSVSSASSTIWHMSFNSSSPSAGEPTSSMVWEAQNVGNHSFPTAQNKAYWQQSFHCVLWPVAFVSHCSFSVQLLASLYSLSGSSPLSSSKRLCFLSSLSFKMTWGTKTRVQAYKQSCTAEMNSHKIDYICLYCIVNKWTLPSSEELVSLLWAPLFACLSLPKD